MNPKRVCPHGYVSHDCGAATTWLPPHQVEVVENALRDTPKQSWLEANRVQEAQMAHDAWARRILEEPYIPRPPLKNTFCGYSNCFQEGPHPENSHNFPEGPIFPSPAPAKDDPRNMAHFVCPHPYNEYCDCLDKKTRTSTQKNERDDLNAPKHGSDKNAWDRLWHRFFKGSTLPYKIVFEFRVWRYRVSVWRLWE